MRATGLASRPPREARPSLNSHPEALDAFPLRPIFFFSRSLPWCALRLKRKEASSRTLRFYVRRRAVMFARRLVSPGERERFFEHGFARGARGSRPSSRPPSLQSVLPLLGEAVTAHSLTFYMYGYFTVDGDLLTSLQNLPRERISCRDDRLTPLSSRLMNAPSSSTQVYFLLLMTPETIDLTKSPAVSVHSASGSVSVIDIATTSTSKATTSHATTSSLKRKAPEEATPHLIQPALPLGTCVVNEVGGNTNLGFYHYTATSHLDLIRHPLLLDQTFRAGCRYWRHTLSGREGSTTYNRYCQSAAVVDGERLRWRVPGVTTYLQRQAERRLPRLLNIPQAAFQYGGLHLLWDDKDEEWGTMQFHRHRDGRNGASLGESEIIVLVMVGDGENVFQIEHEPQGGRCTKHELLRRGGDVVVMLPHVRRMFHMVSVRGTHNEQHSQGSVRLFSFFPSSQSLSSVCPMDYKNPSVSTHLISLSNIHHSKWIVTFPTSLFADQGSDNGPTNVVCPEDHGPGCGGHGHRGEAAWKFFS